MAQEQTADDASIDEIVADLKKHPAFMTEFDPSQPMTPAMEGLQALKYECEDPEERATSYKEDGNENFRNSKYKWAIDSYTEAIKCQCDNSDLNAVLFFNRASAHFRLGNFRSSLDDCSKSIQINPGHLKAFIKGAQCSLKLFKHEGALKWCDDGLAVEDSNATLLSLRKEALEMKRKFERDLRKKRSAAIAVDKENEKLISAIKQRGVRLLNETVTDNVSPLDGAPFDAKVFIDENELLIWPVLFLYPEYCQSDLIQSFSEESTFIDHLNTMFSSSAEKPDWDIDHKYIPSRLLVYFEDQETKTVIPLASSSTLLSALQHPQYVVRYGVPSFFIFVKDSEFLKHFCKKYDSDS